MGISQHWVIFLLLYFKDSLFSYTERLEDSVNFETAAEYLFFSSAMFKVIHHYADAVVHIYINYIKIYMYFTYVHTCMHFAFNI